MVVTTYALQQASPKALFAALSVPSVSSFEILDGMVIVDSNSPSETLNLIKSTGCDAIVRGTGDTAAVCILESPIKGIKGLARLVQIGVNLMFDVTINAQSRSNYTVVVKVWGDVTRAISSPTHANIGMIATDKNGHGTLLLEKELQMEDLIGRSIVVANGDDYMLGVISRSAGVWENNKTVCSCTGKTLWDERREQLARGMTL